LTGTTPAASTTHFSIVNSAIQHQQINRAPHTSPGLSGEVIDFSLVFRIFRRHQAHCPLTSKADPNCPSKVKCPVWVKGHVPGGPLIERSLNTRNWTHAAQMALELESGSKKKEAAAVQIGDAVSLFVMDKSKKSADLQRKVRRLLGRLQDFCERRKIFDVPEVDPATLIRFRHTWTGADTSRRRDQELMKSFFKFCVEQGWIEKSPAAKISPISVTTPQTEVFTREEVAAITEAAKVFPDSYGNTETGLTRQVYAFVLVMRYTGLSIGDVAGLPKSAVRGKQVRTVRDKTGKEVYVSVPERVIDALECAPHDSDEYFFWSGEGKIHTRASKWNTRLQKLFVLAGIRVGEKEWNAKSLRSKKDRPPMRPFSDADPRWFRHSLARDLLEKGVSMEELAEILGNTPEICRKHYSKWDKRRQDRIDEKLSRIWGEEDH
jgi:site-specific recombinase XerD